MKHLLLLPPVACALLATALASARATDDAGLLELAPLATHALGTRIHNRVFALTTDGERSAVACDARPGDGLGWFVDKPFTTGVIECDIKGRNAPGRSFVGIAFHGVDENTFEAVYFRPFNFESAEPDRRSHSVQYISMPEHDWSELRQNHPGVYESDIAPTPVPEAWMHARLVIETTRVSVFVNDATVPCLVVDRIPERKSGWVGLWVGNGSDGMFAKLSITPAAPTPQ